MSDQGLLAGLGSAVRNVRPTRLIVLLLVPLVLALVGDWLREERVVFPAPLPKFTTVPAQP